MISYNSQPILKKKWGKSGRIGKIKTRRVFLNRHFFCKNNVRYFAFLVYKSVGKEVWQFLGESDNLGRPI